MSVKTIKIIADETSVSSFKEGDKPTISSLIPAVKSNTIEAETDKRIDISTTGNIKEPKNAETKKAPNETPRPPR